VAAHRLAHRQRRRRHSPELRSSPAATETLIQESRLTPKLLALCAISGLLEAGGNYVYTTAALIGRLDIAGVLSSLYPAVTILLAALLLKEHASRVQAIGMALALGAVVMISA
jgi:uncharacterized membrane protein